jgi:hypothetical protein
VVVLVVVDLVVVLLLLSAVGAAERAATVLDEMPYECARRAADALPGPPVVSWPVGEPTYVGPDTLEVVAPVEDGEPLRVRCRVRKEGDDPADDRFSVVEAEVLP